MEHANDVLQVQGVNEKGYGITPKLVMQDERLTVEAKAIYAYFCSYAGAGKTAFPSRSKIIADLKMSTNRYYKHFNLLLDNGFIKVEQVKSSKGKFERNIYTLIQTIPCSQNSYTEKDDLPCINYPHTENPCMENEYTNINSIKNNNIKINNKRESESARANQNQFYGKYKKVSLTEKQYQELAAQFGESKAQDYISQLDGYIASTGKYYPEHYATLERWILRDGQKPKAGCAKKNKFVNFEGREWNFEELERLEQQRLLSDSTESGEGDVVNGL